MPLRGVISPALDSPGFQVFSNFSDPPGAQWQGSTYPFLATLNPYLDVLFKEKEPRQARFEGAPCGTLWEGTGNSFLLVRAAYPGAHCRWLRGWEGRPRRGASWLLTPPE